MLLYLHTSHIAKKRGDYMRGWLLNLRKSAGLTMKETGLELGISESYYSLIENGERQSKLDLAIAGKISSLFKISLSTILDEEDKISTNHSQ